MICARSMGSSDFGPDNLTMPRGALKGWHKHGVCLEEDWPEGEVRPITTDWEQRAGQISLGVYYRVDSSSIVDMQSAIAEVGAVFASARVHGNWDALAKTSGKPRSSQREDFPASVSELPVIEWDGSLETPSAHAFCLIGFTDTGFIVQNSWGVDWGFNGFAVLAYEDWLSNSMDAWVATLGVPGIINNRSGDLGRLRNSNSVQPVAQAHSPFSYHLSRHALILDEGRVTGSLGADVVGGNGLSSLAIESPRAWFSSPAVADTLVEGKRKIVIYAHGGLNSEETGLLRARLMTPAFLTNGIYPIFLVWKSGYFETMASYQRDQHDSTADTYVGSHRENFFERTADALIEPAARLIFKAVWDQMKTNARRCSNLAEGAGGLLALADGLERLSRLDPEVEIHLVGHSAGAFVLGHWLSYLQQLKLNVRSAHLMAPACTIGFALKHWFPHLRPHVSGEWGFPLTVHNLSDEREQRDQLALSVIRAYNKSLLYLVSHALEERSPAPLLGMTCAWPESVLKLKKTSPLSKDRPDWSADPITLQERALFEQYFAAAGDLSNNSDSEAFGLSLAPEVFEGAVWTRTDHKGSPLVDGRTVEATHGSFDQNAQKILEIIDAIRGQRAPSRAINLDAAP